MTTTAMTFAFEGRDVRFVGTLDKPEWVAADVCECLDLVNVSEALRSLRDGVEKGISRTDTPSGPQEMLTVTEPGLYKLIFKSRKASAVRFQDWVFSEVLPSIRRTGGYQAPAAKSVPAIAPADRLALIRDGVALARELALDGELEPRDRIFYADLVRVTVAQGVSSGPSTPPLLPGPTEVTIADRAFSLTGRRLHHGELILAGRFAVALYSEKHEGKKPPKSSRYVDGAVRQVNAYTTDDLDVLDKAIRKALERFTVPGASACADEGENFTDRAATDGSIG